RRYEGGLHPREDHPNGFVGTEGRDQLLIGLVLDERCERRLGTLGPAARAFVPDGDDVVGLRCARRRAARERFLDRVRAPLALGGDDVARETLFGTVLLEFVPEVGDRRLVLAEDVVVRE